MIELGIGISVLFLLLGGPIFCVFGFLTSFLIILGFGMAPTMVAQLGFAALNSFVLLAVPLFILAGSLMLNGGMARPLVNFVASFTEGMSGGLSVAVILASGLVGALTGSTLAVIAAVGAIMFPVMKEAGYKDGFSGGVICASATLGNLIPPSIFLILYAYLIEGSTSELFLAGLGPGILLIIILSVTAVLIARKRNYPRPPKTSLREKWKIFLESIPALIMPALVLGGIYGGIFTPTEAAAVACVYSALCGFFWYKQLSLKSLWRCLTETGDMMGQVVILVATGTMLGKAFILMQVPHVVTQWATGSAVGPLFFLFVVEAVFVLMGFFMEGVAIMFVMVPILSPSISFLGLDPLLIGVIFTICIVVGGMTPPVAVPLYASSGLFNVPIEALSREVYPFLIAVLVTLFIITVFPEIAVWLPHAVFG